MFQKYKEECRKPISHDALCLSKNKAEWKSKYPGHSHRPPPLSSSFLQTFDAQKFLETSSTKLKIS